jgi:hypothetical protein
MLRVGERVRPSSWLLMIVCEYIVYQRVTPRGSNLAVVPLYLIGGGAAAIRFISMRHRVFLNRKPRWNAGAGVERRELVAR